MEPVYRSVIAVALGLFKAMDWKIDISGAEHVPEDGPVVVAANHIGYLDFTFLGYAARQRGRLVRFMAKKEIFDRPVAGGLMRAMKHLPVDRFGRATDVLDTAVEALGRGEAIGLFPEGTISRSFVPRAAKSGAARIAMSAGAPLVPAAVWGSQRILTKGRPKNLQRGVPISVAFAERVHYEPGDDPGAVTKQLMATISDLVDQLAANYPDEPAGDDDRWWLPAHLGGSAPTVAEADDMAAEESAARRARRRAERAAERRRHSRGQGSPG